MKINDIVNEIDPDECVSMFIPVKSTERYVLNKDDLIKMSKLNKSEVKSYIENLLESEDNVNITRDFSKVEFAYTNEYMDDCFEKINLNK